jgi:hypothetical protein
MVGRAATPTAIYMLDISGNRGRGNPNEWWLGVDHYELLENASSIEGLGIVGGRAVARVRSADLGDGDRAVEPG